MKRQRQYTRKSRRYCRYLRVPSAPRLRPHRHSNLARKSAFFRLTRRQSGRWQPGEQYPGQRQQETRLQRKCSDSTGIRSCVIRRKRGDRRCTTYRRRLCPSEPAIASLLHALYAQQMIQQGTYLQGGDGASGSLCRGGVDGWLSQRRGHVVGSDKRVQGE